MSNPSIYPCLWFDGQAAEAARFYVDLFGNARLLGENPMVTTLEVWGKKIMALNGGPEFTINPSISLFAVTPEAGDVDRLWTGLSEGGEVFMPLGEYPWSKKYGWARDRFGMTWQVMIGDQYTPKPALTASLLFTGPRFGQAGDFIRFHNTAFPGSDPGFIQYYPPGDPHEGKVLFSEFRLAGYPIIAMDGPGDHGYTFNEGVSLVVECADQATIDHYWDAFTRDGEESMCGWCKDPFGVSWQVVPDRLGEWISDPEHGQATMDALLKMKKLVIDDLRPGKG